LKAPCAESLNPQQTVYDVLSNPENLEALKDSMKGDKVQNVEFDSDSMTVTVASVGSVKFTIVDREEPKTIKFAAAKKPCTLQLLDSASAHQ